jgi:hypothetical protein
LTKGLPAAGRTATLLMEAMANGEISKNNSTGNWESKAGSAKAAKELIDKKTKTLAEQSEELTKHRQQLAASYAAAGIEKTVDELLPDRAKAIAEKLANVKRFWGSLANA